MSSSSRIDRRLFTTSTLGMMGGAALTRFGGSGGTRLAQHPDDTSGQDGPVEAPFERDYEPPSFRPSWRNPQLNRQLVADFVIFAHSDLEKVRMLLDRYPRVLDAAMDWGNGDWETGLGGASHMGRVDIVNFLLERGARIDIFCATMLGKLEVVRAFLELQPNLIDARGPHGFNLHFHAQVGGEKAKPVLDFLQSVKELELRPVPFGSNSNR